MGISLYICIYITYNNYSFVCIKYILKDDSKINSFPKKYMSRSWRERKKPDPCYSWFLERFYTFYQLIPEQPCKVWSLCERWRNAAKAGEQRQERWECRGPAGSPMQPNLPQAKHSPSTENMLGKCVEWVRDWTYSLPGCLVVKKAACKDAERPTPGRASPSGRLWGTDNLSGSFQHSGSETEDKTSIKIIRTNQIKIR